MLVYYRMNIRQVSHGTEINAGGLCIQRVARSGQLRKHLRYSFKMEIPVAQPFGSDEVTENPYHIKVLYPQTGRWVFRQCFPVAVVDGLDPCNGFIIRHFIGVLCHGHQLVIDDSAAFRSELVHSVLSDDSASSCSTWLRMEVEHPSIWTAAVR